MILGKPQLDLSSLSPDSLMGGPTRLGAWHLLQRQLRILLCLGACSLILFFFFLVCRKRVAALPVFHLIVLNIQNWILGALGY